MAKINWGIAAVIALGLFLFGKGKASALPAPLSPTAPVPTPTAPTAPVPTPTAPTATDSIVYDQLYARVAGGGYQIIRISSAQVSEALAKGWVPAVPGIHRPLSVPLDFYPIWYVRDPIP